MNEMKNLKDRMRIVHSTELSKSVITEFFTTHWGSVEMVLSTGVYYCDQLEGYAVVNKQNDIIGLLTYSVEENVCEIISLDSTIENIGIGSALLQKIEEHCKANQLYTIKLITTNDNLHALRFYQIRGYHLQALYPNAVEKAREIKPQIPMISDNGIPIRDELLLVKTIK